MTAVLFVAFLAPAHGCPPVVRWSLVPRMTPHSAAALRAPAWVRPRAGRPVSTVGAVLTDGPMDLRKPVLILAVLGSLVACGDNTDVQRGETNCDSSGHDAANSHDAGCQETGTPGR